MQPAVEADALLHGEPTGLSEFAHLPVDVLAAAPEIIGYPGL
jgi:hypothetical protein